MGFGLVLNNINVVWFSYNFMVSGNHKLVIKMLLQQKQVS